MDGRTSGLILIIEKLQFNKKRLVYLSLKVIVIILMDNIDLYVSLNKKNLYEVLRIEFSDAIKF